MLGETARPADFDLLIDLECLADFAVWKDPGCLADFAVWEDRGCLADFAVWEDLGRLADFEQRPCLAAWRSSAEFADRLSVLPLLRLRAEFFFRAERHLAVVSQVVLHLP